MKCPANHTEVNNWRLDVCMKSILTPSRPIHVLFRPRGEDGSDAQICARIARSRRLNSCAGTSRWRGRGRTIRIRIRIRVSRVPYQGQRHMKLYLLVDRKSDLIRLCFLVWTNWKKKKKQNITFWYLLLFHYKTSANFR